MSEKENHAYWKVIGKSTDREYVHSCSLCNYIIIGETIDKCPRCEAQMEMPMAKQDQFVMQLKRSIKQKTE